MSKYAATIRVQFDSEQLEELFCREMSHDEIVENIKLSMIEDLTEIFDDNELREVIKVEKIEE